MRRRLFTLFVGCLSVAASAITQANSSLQQQRTLYAQAKTALEAGNAGPYLANRERLASYPLTPYLAYDELTARIKTANNQEVEHFLTQNSELPSLRWMQLRWLRTLSERGDVETFLKHYRPELNFTELDCLYGRAQLSQGLTQQAYATAQTLWLSSQSRPNACDPLFSAWHSAGGRTDDHVWQRLVLATEARNTGLAKYLAKEYSQPALAQRLIDVADKPEQLKQTALFSQPTPEHSAMVSLGLRRLIRSNTDLTVELLKHYADRLPFTAEQKRLIARDVGVLMAKRFDSRALDVIQQWDPQSQEPLAAEWRARLLLRLERWQDAQHAINNLPEEVGSTLRWQYWQARSAHIAQPTQSPVERYTALSKGRDFYAFLAADHSAIPYELNNQPVQISPETLASVRNNPLVQRAFEFDALGDFVASQREWHHATQVLSHAEVLALAQLAYEREWFNPAIRTLAQAKYWDDLDIRFPMAYRTDLVREAKAQGLHSSWVYAITRQESAFMPSIKSHAGAMGLMQLMPATAQETARRYNIPLSSTQQALNPTTNIQLGTAYLNQVMQQFNGNRILASAAYNAGPGRVRQWLKNANHLPYDVWIETIPFDETRQYVQNVLTYSVIYGQKLETQAPLIEWHERQFKP